MKYILEEGTKEERVAQESHFSSCEVCCDLVEEAWLDVEEVARNLNIIGAQESFDDLMERATEEEWTVVH